MKEPRRAMLQPEYAELYPELPAGFWVAAWYAAMKAAARVWLDRGSRALLSTRVLRDEHFRFQGGQPRPVRARVRERVSDLGPTSSLPGERYPLDFA